MTAAQSVRVVGATTWPFGEAQGRILGTPRSRCGNAGPVTSSLLIDQRSLLLDYTREGGLGHQVTGGLRWLVTCSCGWGRECSSEWAANAASRLHRQLGDLGVEHVTHVEAPNDAKGWRPAHPSLGVR